MVDININIPALDKLLNVVASGVGAVGGTMLARWKARAGAAVLRIEAQGKADALNLITDAQNKARESLAGVPSKIEGEVNVSKEIKMRLSFQEKKRQRNIESVVGMAASELKDKEVQDHEIDHDWVARFFSDVQDVSSEKMQQIWSKILAGEVETLGRTSLHTLTILKNMTQKDAQLLSKIARFTLDDFVLNHGSTKNIPGFPTYEELLHLEGRSLIHLDVNTILETKNRYHFLEGNIVYSISKNKGDPYTVTIPSYVLSSSGKELCNRMKYRKGLKYQLLEDFVLDTKDSFEQSAFSDYVSLSTDGVLCIHKDFVWDGPSGPAIDTDTFMIPALVHDAMYQLIRKGCLFPRICRSPRGYADDWLYRLCRIYGMFPLRAWWVWLAVRCFGKPSTMRQPVEHELTEVDVSCHFRKQKRC